MVEWLITEKTIRFWINRCWITLHTYDFQGETTPLRTGLCKLHSYCGLHDFDAARSQPYACFWYQCPGVRLCRFCLWISCWNIWFLTWYYWRMVNPFEAFPWQHWRWESHGWRFDVQLSCWGWTRVDWWTSLLLSDCVLVVLYEHEYESADSWIVRRRMARDMRLGSQTWGPTRRMSHHLMVNHNIIHGTGDAVEAVVVQVAWTWVVVRDLAQYRFLVGNKRPASRHCLWDKTSWISVGWVTMVLIPSMLS